MFAVQPENSLPLTFHFGPGPLLFLFRLRGHRRSSLFVFGERGLVLLKTLTSL